MSETVANYPHLINLNLPNRIDPTSTTTLTLNIGIRIGLEWVRENELYRGTFINWNLLVCLHDHVRSVLYRNENGCGWWTYEERFDTNDVQFPVKWEAAFRDAGCVLIWKQYEIYIFDSKLSWYQSRNLSKWIVVNGSS